MKHFFIMRHAKADMPAIQQRDFDRTLTEFGKMQAKQMGGRIKAQGIAVQLVLVSPAMRTATTANIVANVLDLSNDQVQTDQQIYNAEADKLQQIIYQQSDQIQTLMLVGHNPGVSELCMQLTGRGVSLRPASVCLFQADVESWQQIDGRSKLIWQEDA